MSNSIENVLSLFGSQEINAMSTKIGASPEQTQKAIQESVPTIVNAMQSNISKGGADGLLSALDRDHDGSILDDLAGFFQNDNNVQDGNGILKHLLGDKRDPVEQALSSNSGISSSSISKLLPMIAPVIMGYLGKEKRSNNSEFNVTDLISQFSGSKGGIDLDSIMDLFGGQGSNSQTTSGSGGIFNIVSKLFGKK